MSAWHIRVEWGRERGWVRIYDDYARQWHEVQTWAPWLVRRAMEAKDAEAVAAGAAKRRDRKRLAEELMELVD